MRILTHVKQAGTKSFRLATSKLFEYGVNCLSGDTEVYTPVGWIRLDQLTGDTIAMCWDINTHELAFEDCKPIKHAYGHKLHVFSGHFHTLQYTANHRIPYRSDRRFAWKETTALNLVNKGYELPVSAEYKGCQQSLRPEQAQLLAMLQADFSLEGNRWRGSFKKVRKFDRFLDLMVENKLDVSFNKIKDDYIRPAFDAPEWVAHYLDGASKTFKNLMEESVETRKAFLRELAVWDGSARGLSWVYFSTNKANIDYVQLLAHTVGWRASVSVNIDNNRGYGSGNNLPLYKLNIKTCDYINARALVYGQTAEAHSHVYCLTTPTGFFMTRRAGVIQITGNSQNTDKDLLDMFSAPEGYCIVQADQAGAEALIVAYLASAGKYRDLFLVGIKPHTYVALHLFIDKFRGDYPRERYWLRTPAELKALPEWKELSKVIANSPFEYDLGKRTVHASSYKMGPHTFQESVLKGSEGALILDYEQARHFLDVFKQLFPEIVAWQSDIENRIRAERVLRNLFGYPRRFEQILTDGYLRDGISWIPQSTVGCITHLAYNRLTDHIISNRLPWRMFNNKHDSYAALVPVDHAREASERMTEFLAITLIGWDGTPFTMRSEVLVGFNMGKAKLDKKTGVWTNPRGLREPEWN